VFSDQPAGKKGRSPFVSWTFLGRNSVEIATLN
jgi:hypothetical protein